MAVSLSAFLAVLRRIFALMAVVGQRIQSFVNFEDYISSVSAVTAIPDRRPVRTVLCGSLHGRPRPYLSGYKSLLCLQTCVVSFYLAKKTKFFIKKGLQILPT